METIELKTPALLIVLILFIIQPKVFGQSVPIDLEQIRKYDPMPLGKGMIISTR